MHFFTFIDTAYLSIPVTDMPIFTDILQFFRTGEEELMCINRICDDIINVINYVGGRLLQCFLQLYYYLLSWKRKPSSYKTSKLAYQTVF